MTEDSALFTPADLAALQPDDLEVGQFRRLSGGIYVRVVARRPDSESGSGTWLVRLPNRQLVRVGTAHLS